MLEGLSIKSSKRYYTSTEKFTKLASLDLAKVCTDQVHSDKYIGILLILFSWRMP